MSTRLARHLVLTSCFALSLAAFAGPARAQEVAPPAPAPAQDGATAPDPERAASLLARMKGLYGRLAERPAPIDRSVIGDAEAIAKERSRYAKEMDAWRAGLEELPELSVEYREAAGDAAEPVAWFYAGFGNVRRADTVGRSQGRELMAAGADDLRVFLERAPREAAFRTEAQLHLAYSTLRAAGGEADAVRAAIPVVDAAVRAQLADGRAAEAGRLAFLALKGLIATEQESEAAALVTGWDADTADFGPSTDSVRMLVRRSRVRPGAAMPELPALSSITGEPMPWGELAGKPYVLHFFSTTVSSTPREIETILVPIRDKWAEKGLRLVGCSTDREMTDAEIERTKANWEEWGKKETLHDGRKPSVREWAEIRGVDWPWYWDGKWMKNALAQELGVEVNAPFAILVDAKGVIRWRGQPFQGLAGAVDKLMQP